MAFALSGFAEEIPLEKVRALYARASEDEKACKELIDLLESPGAGSGIVLAGYKASATMVMAKHRADPLSKLSYFNRGKTALEKAIEKDTNNVELRYLRLTIQTNVPSFLGYSSSIENDRVFLKQALPGIRDKGLYEMVSSYLERIKK